MTCLFKKPWRACGSCYAQSLHAAPNIGIHLCIFYSICLSLWMSLWHFDAHLCFTSVFILLFTPSSPTVYFLYPFGFITHYHQLWHTHSIQTFKGLLQNFSFPQNSSLALVLGCEDFNQPEISLYTHLMCTKSFSPELSRCHHIAEAIQKSFKQLNLD